MRGVALRALKTSAEAADRLHGPRRGVVVLIYHCVGRGSGLELDLPVERFEEQIAWLAAEQRVTTLDEALDTLAAPVVPERDPVVVTFDDGPADFADVAVPILVRHRIPVTMYLATGFIDDELPFPYGAPSMSWAAVRDTLATGLVTIGSHTHTHALLDRLPEDKVDEELDRSTGAIEQHLGVTAAHFAYPKSLDPSAAADRAVRARFRSAALAGTRPNRYGRTDPYRLHRSPIQHGDEMRWFKAKASGGMAFEDDVRRVLNRWRYADADS